MKKANKKGIEYYKQAVELDPNYALAYVGIGSSYVTAAGWYLPPNEAMPQVKAAAQKALELDESLADAHSLLAEYEIWYGWDWVTSEREVKRAIELDTTVGHDTYGMYLAIMGRSDQSIKEMELNQGLFPLDLQVNSDLALFYLRGGLTDKAIEQARKTIELDQNHSAGHKILGLAYERKRNFPDAIASLDKARSLDNNPELIGYLGYVYAAAGKKAEALRIVDEFERIIQQVCPGIQYRYDLCRTKRQRQGV
jgi:tetratricopeptide (TPR) repeat protein